MHLNFRRLFPSVSAVALEQNLRTVLSSRAQSEDMILCDGPQATSVSFLVVFFFLVFESSINVTRTISGGGSSFATFISPHQSTISGSDMEDNKAPNKILESLFNDFSKKTSNVWTSQQANRFFKFLGIIVCFGLTTIFVVASSLRGFDAKTSATEGSLPGCEGSRLKPFVEALRPGVIILGMHRSGTSLLGGLVSRMGLNLGGPLMSPAVDNEKGFYERLDVAAQNDYLMKSQNVLYHVNTSRYDVMRGIKDVMMATGTFFEEGKKALSFFNNETNYPWMMKDPRLCITMRTWLPFLNFVPAVLFTYRHPMDVALSMSKRENEKFSVKKGLTLWYVYNKRAILQTQDLCRVTTAHRRVMQQPQKELDLIYDALIYCGVTVPRKLNASDIASFMDANLQHGNSTLIDHHCNEDLSVLLPPPSWHTSTADDIALYREVMGLYCAMEDGRAFASSYQFANFIEDIE